MENKAEEWSQKIKSLLVGIDRYNPEIAGTLEEYVSYQTEAGCYDFEANLSLLKIYQFRPASVNIDVTVQLLLKALTRLPSTDFVTLKCVLPQALQSERAVQDIMELYAKLECCQFSSFWLVLQAMDRVSATPFFKEAIRNYVCHVVDISYQNIPYPLLQDYLGDPEEKTITDLISKNGWTLKDGGGSEGEAKVVVIKNQEATIRPKKILAKVEFDSVSGLLATAASR